MGVHRRDHGTGYNGDMLGAATPTVDMKDVEWGTVAEWVGSIGAAGALILTYFLLRHEIGVRKASEKEAAAVRQREVARRQLAEIRDLLLRWPHEDVTSPRRLAQLARDIEMDRFEITDEELRGRLQITRLVAFTLGADDETFERSSSSTHPASRRFAVVRFGTLLASTALSLEHYITGQQLPPWPESLPQHPGSAQAWIWTAPDER